MSLALAASPIKSLGNTKENPAVGCVIVKKNNSCYKLRFY